MSGYEAVIGLEVHVHLATKSKLFCSCSTKFGQAPNSSVCEVCSGMPGALPSPNRQAVRFAAMLGLALDCGINRVSRFARKNYFYPDLPSGYQISQFELPICENGRVLIGAKRKKIGVTRIHMENDAGKNTHSHERNLSYIDLNRAGDPLVEIVSEPDLRSGEEAVQYLKALHRIVTYLGISDGSMEEGSFRCDANVSIRPAGSKTLGTRTELKNLNSFRFVQKAIDYEIARQEDILEDGGAIVQETRLYDSDKGVTQSMRGKEEAHDYRYFPDPDILPVEISLEELEELRSSLPELPAERAERFMKEYSLAEADADFLTQNKALADFFEESAGKSDGKKAAAYILGNCARECNSRGLAMNPAEWKITPDHLAELASLTQSGVISAKIASDIFADVFDGAMPKRLVEEKGLAQISDAGELEKTLDQILAANPSEAQAYKDGKKKLLSFFVGQIMKATKGKANPALVNELLIKKLGG